MLFNSIDFIIFLPIVIILTHLTPKHYRWIVLLSASYLFYMWWKPAYAVLIMASTVVDYLVALRMHNSNNRKIRRLFLVTSLATNLGLLFSFKYFNFFNDSLTYLLGNMGFDYQIQGLNVLLPVGISFYTFQTLSYTIDVYRGKIEPTRHFGIFALYVSFFPQLVAGPIERAGHLIPQFKKMGKFEWSVLNESITRIFWGLFKKVVIADRLSLYVDAVYGNVSHHGSVSLILATYFFAIQIYCDFSAYSDIAIGSARLFGIRLRENFNNPYLATSITDFWRRWHISLSSWLRDYLYISLGGNRKSISRTYYNLIIVMLLGGLWHGAGWTFVFWGGLHGMYLIWERIIKNIKLKYFDVSTENNNNKGKKRMKNLTITWLKRIIVFHLVCLTWIFFRADTFNTAFEILIRIWKLIPGFFTDAIIFGHLITGMAISVVIISFSRWAKTRDNRHISEWYSIVSVGIIIVSIILLGVEQGSAFIYFQF